jgi:hypothetical protein
MKRADFVIIALILAVALAAMGYASALRRAAPAENLRAEIYEDGALKRVLPLNENADVVIDTDRGYNRVVVGDGGIRISAADCASQTCVHSGTKALPGDMIACLPHRLVIKISGGDAAYDAVSY